MNSVRNECLRPEKTGCHAWRHNPSFTGRTLRQVTWTALRRALTRTYDDVLQHHTSTVSAALSYYFMLSIFPTLILLSAALSYVAVPALFAAVLVFMGRLLPSETMGLIHTVLGGALSANRGAWLSVGLIGTLWVVSSAFDATIEALDIAYDVQDQRPIWKTRLLALGLAGVSGILLLVALAVMMVGPRFGDWLAARLELSREFVMLWPFLHWSIAISFAVVAVEAIYFLAPNVKQRFVASLPGAILSVTLWITLSYLLGIYVRHFAHFNRTYGTLGGFIALMTWLYWNSFALLLGAELNAELAKESESGKIEQKTSPQETETIEPAE